MEFTGLKHLYNFTSLINDTSRGKGFRAFLNSCVDRAYFSNNNEKEEENTVKVRKSILYF